MRTSRYGFATQIKAATVIEVVAPFRRMNARSIVNTIAVVMAAGTVVTNLSCAESDASERSRLDPVETVQSALRTTDAVTLTTATGLTNRRTALINIVWGRNTINTTDGVTSQTALTSDIPDLTNLASATQFA